MENVIAYVRISTSKQVNDGNGIEAQRQGIIDYCKRMNYSITEWFIDKAKSRQNLNRPEYSRMIREIVMNKVKKVIIYKRERLIGDVRDLFEIEESIIRRYDCVFESVQDGIITYKRANEKFMQTVFTAKDALEIEQVSERTIDCLIASAYKGNYTISRPPLGYIRCKRGSAKKAIEPDPDMKDSLTHIFDLAASGDYSVNGLAKYLQSINYLDQKEWTEKKLRKILTNHIYIGDFITSRFNISEHSPAIISKDLFYSVQKQIARYRLSYRHFYVLERVVFCSCGERMLYETVTRNRGGKKKTYSYFKCSSCGSRISMDKLMSQLDLLISEKKAYDRHCKLFVLKRIIKEQLDKDAVSNKSIRQILLEIENIQNEVENNNFYIKLQNMSNKEKAEYLSANIHSVILDMQDDELHIDRVNYKLSGKNDNAK